MGSHKDLGKGNITLKFTRRGKVVNIKHLKGLSYDVHDAS